MATGVSECQYGQFPVEAMVNMHALTTVDASTRHADNQAGQNSSMEWHREHFISPLA